MFDDFRKRIGSSLRRLRDLFSYPDDPICAARLQEEQFAAVRANTPGMMVANVGNGAALLATFSGTPLGPRALLWTVALFAAAIYIFWRARRRVRRRSAPSAPTRIGRRAVLNAFVLGLLWAAVPLLFFLEASPGARLMVISLTAGMLFGGAFSLARAPVAATVFALPITAAAAVTLLSGGDPDLIRITLVLCIYVAVLLREVYVEAENFKDRVLSQFGAEREARTDPLTGLPNRLAFNGAIERDLSRIRRHGGQLALLCVDIDNFKTINDRYGHPAGDALLAQAARRMRAALRGADLVARMGGDEFAIIVANLETKNGAGIVADRILACFEEPFLLDGRLVRGAASVGGALAPGDGLDSQELFKRADLALYQAKQRGGGYRFFRPEEDFEAIEADLLEQDLRRALANDQMSLVYQPIIRVATREVVGCEALLRWSHPTRGAISPAAFIPVAELTGVIHELGLWALERACAAIASLPEDIRVCVNVSAAQLAQPDFAVRALEAIARTSLPPRRLDIEITERATSAAVPAIRDELVNLSRAGMSLSLDDFGSGVSSLSQLCSLPIRRVKIDGPLVRDAATRRDSAAIILGLARMANAFHLGLVAEGVETPEQLQWLAEIGVDEAQGFVIAAPMAFPALETFIAGWSPTQLAGEDRARA